MDSAQSNLFHGQQTVILKFERLVKETAKAVLVQIDGIQHWVPKSASTIILNEIVVESWIAARMNESGAMFSKDGKHRYCLWRTWNHVKKVALCIGLNPSTANAASNDPTIERLVQTLTRLDYGGIRMVNLFSWISTSPSELVVRKKDEEIDFGYIFGQALICQEIIFCWGQFPQAKERAERVMNFFTDAVCFGVNKDGSPWHPLAMFYAGLKAEDGKLFKFKTHLYEQNKVNKKSKKRKHATPDLVEHNHNQLTIL